MAYILEIQNPFDVTKIKKHIHPGGITVKEWLLLQDPKFIEFATPTICIFNGQPILRAEWPKRIIGPQDIVSFTAVPQGPFLIIAAVIIIAVVALTAMFVKTVSDPTTPGELPASDPVFTVKGQQNTIRLGEPIEVPYGRNRIYPSLASRPYYQYLNNDQFQYTLFCIGQGSYDIEAVQIGDSPITDFQEVQYEIIPPGGTVTLFPANVYTSAEAGGQEIFAPNEEDYIAPGYVGPFPANPAGTEATKLQVDVIFPNGIYVINDAGELTSMMVTIEIDYREIDDAGVPVGAGVWQPFTTPYPYDFMGATTTPQRRTLSVDVPAGRYEVRMRRNVPKTISHKVGNSIVWEGLRSFLSADGPHDYGNITLLAVVIRASNNLNDRTQLKFNVICTRQLPIYESGGFSAPIATRSLVWAFVDVFRSRYGGRVPDNYFDWEVLLGLETLGITFDWIFRDEVMVWEAARTVARVGRAIPLLAGSLITLRRDEPAEVPVTLFTPDNIVAGSFNYGVLLWEDQEYDSLRVEYTEPATGYKQEQVLVTLPGGTTDHPKDLRIPGIQDRTNAYREGLYTLASERYLRDNITFDTGLEGYIPIFGDLIAVSRDCPRMGQFGFVVNAAQSTGHDYILWVSEPLRWDESGEHVIALRGSRAEYMGPYTVHRTEDPMQVMVTIPSDSSFESGGPNFLLGGNTEPMLFLFGVAGSMTRFFKIARVEPQGGQSVRITAVNYAPIIYTLDGMDPPAWTPPALPPPIPALPEIRFLFLSQIDVPVPTIQASWAAAAGANYYIVQSSVDGDSWTDRGSVTQTALTFIGSIGLVFVRVAAVGAGQGPWKTEAIEVKALLGLTVIMPWDDLEWEVAWTDVLNVTGWVVRVYDNSESAPLLKSTDILDPGERSYNYDYTQASGDGNLVREMKVEVSPLYTDGEGPFVSQTFHNGIPPPPGSPAATYNSVTPTEHIYQFSWTIPPEADLYRVRLWLSPVNGFDPALVTPKLDTTSGPPYTTPTSSLIGILKESGGGHSTYYWRVAFFDVWGMELDTNVSSQRTIPSHGP